jgi:tetratricopeptide (TPR) repeat protein
MRHEILDPQSYEELAERWGAHVAEHPGDVRAWVEWGDALRYCGRHAESRGKYERAFEIDSIDVAAVNAFAAPDLHAEHPDTWRRAYLRLQHAFARDPTDADIPYSLVLGAMRDGNLQLMRRCFETMAADDMPRPLRDYGRNMLAGAPEGAVILTNGDNDTYPCWLHQHLSGSRQDVEIVNLALLNTAWYLRHLRDRGLPIELTDREIAQLKPTHEKTISDQMQEQIFDNLCARAGSPPLFYSVTVGGSRRVLPCKTRLEGLLERVIAEQGAQRGVCEHNWEATRDLIDRVYDLGRATDVYMEWERENAVARLMHNYAAILHKLGAWLLESGQAGEADPYLYDAVRILTFHGEDAWAKEIMTAWEPHSGERKARLFLRARQLTGP